jgi:hypothetical protein
MEPEKVLAKSIPVKKPFITESSLASSKTSYFKNMPTKPDTLSQLNVHNQAKKVKLNFKLKK